jgi:molybdopterin/thiamine biosynthesis adenylyltransferase
MIGLGALGSAMAEILVRQGVGTLIGVDSDPRVEEHNLDRQFLYRESQLGKPKALAAEEAISEVNSEVQFIPYVGEFEEAIRSSCSSAISSSNVLVSAVDNGLARYSVSKYSLIHDIPHLDGATGGFNCRAYVMPHPRKGPCLICTFSRKDYKEISRPFSCTRRDNSQPAPAITETGFQAATVLAIETVKLLLGKPVQHNEIRVSMNPWSIFAERIDASPSHVMRHIII